MALSCLTNIVGLDRAACDCYPDEPENYNTSTSGYYLTDEEYGVPVRGAILASNDCTETTIWDVMANARTNAIRDFEIDLKNALDQAKLPGFKQWTGVIGKPAATRNTTTSNTYAGVILRPKKRMPHQSFVITDLYLGMADSGTYTVRLNSNSFGYTEQTQAITVTGGAFKKETLSTPWTLPLYDDETDDLYYSLSVAHGGSAILDNQSYCCGRPSWMNAFEVGGFTSDSVTENWLANNRTMYGIAFKGYVTCSYLQWICELTELAGAEMLSLIGRAIQHKATVKILSQLMRGQEINKYTLLNQEDTYARIQWANDHYNELISYIAQNMPDGASGCYSCAKSSHTIAFFR